VDKIRHTRAFFLWNRVPDNAYASFPGAAYSVSFFLECNAHSGQSAMVLAYALWHITDACGYLHASNPKLLACSYMFLSDGVYGFCLYNKGFAPQYEKFSRDARANLNAPFWYPVLSTWCPANLSEIVNDILIHRCVTNSAYVYSSRNSYLLQRIH
jgi:hypothetical protein